MENVTYNCTLTYGTCEIFGSLYSFQNNAYGRSYFPVLPIKDLINKYGYPTTSYKLAIGVKPSIYHFRVLFFPCVVWKDTANVGTKTLNTSHQAQMGFSGIFIGIPHHQNGYLVYVTHKRNIISSYDVVFDDIFSFAFMYTLKPYEDAMSTQLAVSYIHFATSSREQTGNIITSAHFEERNLFYETCNYTESGKKSDDDLTLEPLFSEEEMDVMSSGNESDAEPISTEMLEDIRDGSHSLPSIHRREAR